MRNHQVILFIFTIFFPLTWFTPRSTADDYDYAHNWLNYERILTLNDYIESMFTHYMTKSGRIWGNGLAAIFSTTETDFLFKLLNTLVFTCLIFYSVKLIHKQSLIPLHKNCLFVFFLLFWFLIPVASQTLLWMCGALNYLWPACFTILLCYITIQINHQPISNIFLPLITLGSILCGWQNEAFSVPTWGASVLYYLIKKPSINKQVFLIWVAYTIGTFLLVFAPGSIHRANMSLLATNDIVLALLFRIYTLGMVFVGVKLKATMLLMVILIGMKIKYPKHFYDFCSKHLFYLLVIICGIGFIVIIAYVEERGLMWIELTAILTLYSLGLQYGKAFFTYRNHNFLKVSMYIVLLIFTINYSYAVNIIYQTSKADQLIFQQYKSSPNGVIRSPLSPDCYDNRFVFYCNDVKVQRGVTRYFKKEIGTPFRLIPAPFYDAMHGDKSFFIETNRVIASSPFYTLPEEMYYLAPVEKNKYPTIRRNYRFSDNSWIKKNLPKITNLIENFYSNTNLRIEYITVNNRQYVFVNKLKRMIPGLELVELDFK